MGRLLNFRYLWVFPLLFWGLVTGVSLFFSLRAIDHHVLALSATQARDFFRMVESMRSWNASHGGIYVLETEKTPPNPYLHVPNRDLVTTTGKKLTMMNPAYMTREMAAVIYDQAQIGLRMTSLKPVNPINVADEWESAALKSFENGVPEHIEMFTRDGHSSIRYIAPLRTGAECLKCHEQQGYRVGDIRGGISVKFSADPVLTSVGHQRKNVWLTHGVAWLLMSGLGIFALSRFRDLMNRIDTARREQEQLVEVRTTELQNEVRERRRAEASLHYLLDSTSYGIVGVDGNGHVTFCNRYGRALMTPLLGGQPLLGSKITELFGADSKFSAAFEMAMQGGQTGGRLEIKDAATGAVRNLEYILNALGSEGMHEGCVLALSDITARQRREDEMWRQAHFDALTALPNRVLFTNRMVTVLKNRNLTESSAVLFIDLDDFKPVNDRYGHEAGDIVLVEIARRLEHDVRDSDFAARLGGDEFVVVLGGIASEAQAATVAEKLLRELAEPISLGNGILVQVCASIGIAMFPKDGENIDLLLRHADLAMYRAKQHQKGSYGFYAPHEGAESNHTE